MNEEEKKHSAITKDAFKAAVDVVRCDPYFGALLENPRMAALMAYSLFRERDMLPPVPTDKAFYCLPLLTIAMRSATEYCQRNGLCDLSSRSNLVVHALIRALQHHLFLQVT